MRSREAQLGNGNHNSDVIIDLAHKMPIHVNVWMGIFIYRCLFLCQFPAGILFTCVEGICI